VLASLYDPLLNRLRSSCAAPAPDAVADFRDGDKDDNCLPTWGSRGSIKDRSLRSGVRWRRLARHSPGRRRARHTRNRWRPSSGTDDPGVRMPWLGAKATRHRAVAALVWRGCDRTTNSGTPEVSWRSLRRRLATENQCGRLIVDAHHPVSGPDVAWRPRQFNLPDRDVATPSSVKSCSERLSHRASARP
jgi:hypothetical protein